MRFLKCLLFAKGTGWLRWGLDQRTVMGPLVCDAWGPPDDYTVAPPARRLWEMAVDFVHGWRGEETAWTYLKDSDRSTDLWNFGGRLIPWRR